MSDDERSILQAILKTQPLAYGVTILDQVNASVKPNWLTRRWPSLSAFQGMSAGGLYTHLMHFEKVGWVTSEWSAERFPERGNRRRRYYWVTDQGRAALK